MLNGTERQLQVHSQHVQEYRSRVLVSRSCLQGPVHQKAHISDLLSLSLQADELFGTDDRHVSDACTEAY